MIEKVQLKGGIREPSSDITKLGEIKHYALYIVIKNGKN